MATDCKSVGGRPAPLPVGTVTPATSSTTTLAPLLQRLQALDIPQTLTLINHTLTETITGLGAEQASQGENPIWPLEISQTIVAYLGNSKLTLWQITQPAKTAEEWSALYASLERMCIVTTHKADKNLNKTAYNHIQNAERDGWHTIGTSQELLHHMDDLLSLLTPEAIEGLCASDAGWWLTRIWTMEHHLTLLQAVTRCVEKGLVKAEQLHKWLLKICDNFALAEFADDEASTAAWEKRAVAQIQACRKAVAQQIGTFAFDFAKLGDLFFPESLYETEDRNALIAQALSEQTLASK